MPQNFPPIGLTYFWCFNDECREEHTDWQIAEFAKAGVATVCMMARSGLLLPYCGDDWFAHIRRAIEKCADAGIGVWIYDEDPCPSGNAGGWVTLEDAGNLALGIELSEAEPNVKHGELFCFPTGKLLWAGLVPDEKAGAPDEREVIDLTSRVGLVRREWRVTEAWDSRYYYPATPLYVCGRADTRSPEFAMKAPRVPDGMKLVAFVARRCDYAEYPSLWGGLADSLNPDVTQVFIERTYERYYEAVGDMFGDPITAFFTDEPKYLGRRPWTPGMFEDFASTFGYDLQQRLYDLFTSSQTPQAMRTRLDYRKWCGERFEEAWVKPVSDWCHGHGVNLVGHISPEDDLVEQMSTISNLFPLQKYFDLAGLDLIIPAVGDADHPMINVGVTLASSVAQQREMLGVMSESLACSGLDFTAQEAAKILNWQTVLGMTTPLIHAIFSSTEWPRLLDCPPDFGPQSPRWEGMREIGRSLRGVQEKMIGATQIAPVAILWPIRSFQAEGTVWQPEPGGMRSDFLDLLHACLSHQVGTHLLDEEDLWGASFSEGKLRLGRAEYSFVLVPSCTVLHERSVERLKALADEGMPLFHVGVAPSFVQTEAGIEPLDFSWCPEASVSRVADELPRLIAVEGSGSEEIRCTSWIKDDEPFTLLINIGKSDWEGEVNGRQTALPVGRLEVLASY